MRSLATYFISALVLLTSSLTYAADKETTTAATRFLEYVQIDTQSVMPDAEEDDRPLPSSEGQVGLSGKIRVDLGWIGVNPEQIRTLEDASFFVHLPATPGHELAPHIAFAAHMDTYYLVSGKVNPIIHDVRPGKDIKLKDGVVIPASELEPFVDQRVITSDGTSVLGADDKAGLAIMVSMIETILVDQLPHGELTFWFCVDEEIGELNVDLVPRDLIESWDLLWTIDGQELGPIDVANFVGRYVTVTFKGMDAHPGDDGARLRPALYGAVDMAAELLKRPTPMQTAGTEKGFHLVDTLEGNASEAVVVCLPRSFDRAESDDMVEEIRQLATQAAERWRLDVEVIDNIHYVNVGEDTMQVEHLLLPAMDAHQALGIEPYYQKARGGTDHAIIKMTVPSIRGANMGTGGRNMHSPNEFLAIEEFGQTLKIAIHMVGLYAEMTEGD